MHALALHNDGTSWKIALVSQHEGSEQVELLRSLRPEDKPLETLKTVLFGKTVHIASAISAEQILLRPLELDILGWNNILKILPFQAEDVIPFPKEQTLLLAFLEKETSQGSSIRLVATQKTTIENHLSDLAHIEIDPRTTTTTVHALKRWAKFVVPQENSLLLLYIGQESSFGALLLNGEIATFKTFSSENKGEWLRVKEFLESKADNAPLPWLVAGNPELLNVEVFSLPVSKQLQEYAIPIGICLDVLTRDGRSIQWRQDELRPPVYANKTRKKLFTATAIFLACAALLGPLGHFLISRHQENLLARAEHALQKLHINAKNPSLEDSLELLTANHEELALERQFGPYSASLSTLLAQISQASLSLEKTQLPVLKKMSYLSTKQPRLEIQWICPSIESARTLKTSLSGLQSFKTAELRENKTLLLTTFVIE